jgi:hypothetical protein
MLPTPLAPYDVDHMLSFIVVIVDVTVKTSDEHCSYPMIDQRKHHVRRRCCTAPPIHTIPDNTARHTYRRPT